MAYTVTIVYAGVQEPASIPFVSPICAQYVPTNSYVDTAAYDGTVYDMNTKGKGIIDLVEPYATTSFPYPVPLAQFKLATVGEDVLDGDEQPTGAKTVTFTVDSYADAFWYMEAGKALADQGFTVTVEEVESDGNG